MPHLLRNCNTKLTLTPALPLTPTDDTNGQKRFISMFTAPSIEELYRPDPKKSVQEQIYSMANNPSPVMELMQIIYAAHASGRVEFYVEDAAEMQSLRAPLKVNYILIWFLFVCLFIHFFVCLFVFFRHSLCHVVP